MITVPLIIPPFKYRKKKKVYRSSEKIISMSVTWNLYITGLSHNYPIIEQNGSHLVINSGFLPKKSYGFSFLVKLSEYELDMLKDPKFGKTMDDYLEEIINPVFYGCIEKRWDYLNSIDYLRNNFTSLHLLCNFDYVALCQNVLSMLDKLENEGYTRENLKFSSKKGIEFPEIKTRLDEWWEWVYE